MMEAAQGHRRSLWSRCGVISALKEVRVVRNDRPLKTHASKGMIIDEQISGQERGLLRPGECWMVVGKQRGAVNLENHHFAAVIVNFSPDRSSSINTKSQENFSPSVVSWRGLSRQLLSCKGEKNSIGNKLENSLTSWPKLTPTEGQTTPWTSREHEPLLAWNASPKWSHEKPSLGQTHNKKDYPL